MIYILINLIQLLVRALVFAIIINVVLSYFMSPYHPIKVTLNRILEPLLAPIRKVVKPFQGIDFSPFILIISLQVIEVLVIGILRSLV